MQKNGGSAPTGCYKCGRPGHWSRDCPFSASNPNSNSDLNTNPNAKPSSNSTFNLSSYRSGPPNSKPKEKADENAKKPPRTRPKLTPELLLSNDGLGYVLRHFTRSFKYRGRGHEISDLENLIGLYVQWNSHLIPYYSFDQFVHKVEKVGASKRVRMCIRELRERVANGGDPTKLHESPVEHVAPSHDDGVGEEMNQDDLVPTTSDTPMDTDEADGIQEEMFDEIYKNATDELNQSMPPAEMVATEAAAPLVSVPAPKEIKDQGESSSNKIQVTDDQITRMEANRLKALERIAARARAVQ